ncbi:MAG TPA: PQQ-binding-like beta-propeller repeat protein, partial [Armatimonadota bacterium]|nr:PQQ-binding-like beta-propeller repeat protein [Armatimonadota bacterium]
MIIEQYYAASRLSIRAIALLIAVAALLAGGSAHAAPATDWPTVHHDGARSGRTPDTVRGPYALQWATEFPNEVLATRLEAIVAGSRVFIGTYSGNLYALDRHTGAVLWKHAGGAPILHSPAVENGIVFYGTAGQNGSLFAVDADSGKPRWRFRPDGGGFAASPLVAGGAVYLGGRDGVFYAVDARTGKQR